MTVWSGTAAGGLTLFAGVGVDVGAHVVFAGFGP